MLMEKAVWMDVSQSSSSCLSMRFLEWFFFKKKKNEEIIANSKANNSNHHWTN